jgi:hypothetical protein
VQENGLRIIGIGIIEIGIGNVKVEMGRIGFGIEMI